jgi:hypothetical protein
MNFRRQTFLGIAAAIFVCASASTALPLNLPITSSWAQRKITSGKFAIHSACMMPPQTQPSRLAWSAALENVVESHLKSEGIAISSATNPLSSGASENEIRSVISQIQQKFSSVLPLIKMKPGAIGKSAYTLGDQVGMLPCSENSDILVFVHGVVGPLVKDIALLVTIADAKTGEIVAFIQVYPTDASLFEAESAFGQKLYEQLTEMKIGSANKRH